VELRKTLSKKPVKFLTLLLTAMLIATASAAVYYSLTFESKVTIAGFDVKFTQGNDSVAAVATPIPAGWPASRVKLAGLKSYPNVTSTYDQAVNITNLSPTIDAQFRLRHSSINALNGTASISNFTRITFRLIHKNGTQGGYLEYTTGGDDTWERSADMNFIAIKAGEVWAVKVEIVAAAGATTGIMMEIVMYIDVQ